MTSQTASENYSALLERLQKLERDNRRMKRVGFVVLVATAALIFMGQAGKNRALDADSLVIRDASGRVRIELGIGDNSAPVIKMFGGSDNKTASVVLHSDQGGSGLSFLGGGTGLMMLSNNPPTVMVADGTGNTVVGVASVEIHDSDKFSAIVGRADTVNTKTGATTKTSAASLLLFGKDGKVVWEAP